MKVLGPNRSRKLLQSDPGRSLLSADYSVYAELRSELSWSCSLSVTNPWDVYNTKLVKCNPNWLPQSSPAGIEKRDVDKRHLGVPDVRKADPC